VNVKDWLRECERVASKLQVNIKSDAKEWRAHIEQTKGYSENIRKIFPSAR